MSIKFLVFLGGGVILGWGGGGGSADFIFMGAGIFLTGVVDVRASGSWMSAPKFLFFPRFRGPMTPGSLRDIRPENFFLVLHFRP